MLYVNLTPQFRAGAVRALRNLSPAAENMRMKLFKGASTAMIGAVAGWGGVMVLGAVLMAGASREPTQNAPEPQQAVAAVVAPVVAAVPKEAALSPAPAPTPSPTPTKVTQRVDMSPTAAIPDPPKPHKKPHKKKPLDNAN